MTILYEDKDLLVVLKPAGVPTQTKRLGEQDMVSLLKNYRARQKEDTYIGVVHRLDQPVQGLMVFAKNQKAAAALSKQIAEKAADKSYYAVVERRTTQYPGTEVLQDDVAKSYRLEDYLLKDAKTNTSRIVPENTKDAKKARLTYEVLEEKEALAILDIHLETGRHHQIRVQFSGAGLPLVGDRKYNGQGTMSSYVKVIEEDRETPLRNVALCSYYIGFVHPTSLEKMEFSILNPFVLKEIIA